MLGLSLGEYDDPAGEDKLFAFPPRPVRFLRPDVDWAVTHTGDSNTASISSLTLYDCPPDRLCGAFARMPGPFRNTHPFNIAFGYFAGSDCEEWGHGSRLQCHR